MIRNSWLIFIGFLLGCQEEGDIGTDFFEGQSYVTSVIDTLTVKASTIVYDSFPTNRSGRLLIGQYIDEYVGSITTHGVFQVGPSPSINYFLDENSVRFDSLVLHISSDGYTYRNPAGSSISVEVRKLASDIEPEEDGLIYNTSFRELEALLTLPPLGASTFRTEDDRFDSLSIRLSDDLGEEMFERAQSSDEIYLFESEFLEFLKGFVISPTGDDTPILGIAESLELRLYYTDFSVQPNIIQQYLPFAVGSRTYFNTVLNNRKGTLYEKLTTLEEALPSELTENNFIMYGGANLAIRLEIPHLRNLLLENNDYLIAAATMEIPVVKDTYGDGLYLPETLESEFVNEDNEFNGNIITSEAKLTLDDEFQRDTKYEMDVLNFINTQLSISENNHNALVLKLPREEMNSSVIRAILGDQQKGLKVLIHTIASNNG